jgi:hypothetical protein
MKLTFTEIQEVANGKYPELLHFFDNEAQVLFLRNGELYGKISNTPMGDWNNREFEDEIKIGFDKNMEKLELSSMPEFGVFGCYRTGNIHKLIIYEMQIDISSYLNSGNIKHSISSPIATFSLNLENPKNTNPEYRGENVLISEDFSHLYPGSKLVFKFQMGDSEDYEMGSFYVDRSSYSVLSENVGVDGRNLIGKALKDQSFGNDNTFSFNILTEIIRKILIDANINPYKILIENTSKKSGFTFQPNMECLVGLEEVFKATLNWKIEELTDGAIVVGSPTYTGFTRRDRFEFYRDKDIFGREITRDDMDSYRNVCVHDKDFNIKIFKDVVGYIGWNLQSKKTLYVEVPDGTILEDAEAYANELANRLSNVGKIETFTGPLKPYLLIGDEAVIINKNGSEELGLITEINHRFGKVGFYTDFTVDSGGSIGKGRLVDYINQITKERKTSSRTYE